MDNETSPWRKALLQFRESPTRRAVVTTGIVLAIIVAIGWAVWPEDRVGLYRDNPSRSFENYVESLLARLNSVDSARVETNEGVGIIAMADRYSINVTRTNSITSPYLAEATIHWRVVGRSGTSQEFTADLTFVGQGEKWVYRSSKVSWEGMSSSRDLDKLRTLEFYQMLDQKTARNDPHPCSLVKRTMDSALKELPNP